MEVKPGYKQTEVGVIPEDWECSPLGELCTKIQDGTHFSPTSGRGNYRYVTSRNIGYGALDMSSAQYIDAAQHEAIYKRCDVKKGDLLLTKDGANTGNAALNNLDEEFSLLSSVAFLRFDPKRHIATYFLQQILSWEGQSRIKEAMSGNAITRLTLEKINKLEYPYPPLPEQRAIAGALSDVDALLDGLDRLITKKRNIKQAAMQELLTGKTRLPGFEGEWEEKKTEIGLIPKDWDAVTLESISDVKSGKRLPKGYYLTDNVTPHPYIRVSDMHQGGVDLSDIQYVPAGASSGISNYRIFVDDIFISVAGSLGIVGIIPKALNGANLTENADRLTNLHCDQDYLFYVMSSSIVQQAIEAIQTVGAQPKLALTRLQKFLIPLPPSRPEQAAIASVLSDMDAEIEALEQRRSKTQDLKKAMMQELLTGKTRLVVPQRVKKPEERKHNWAINEAVIVAVLANHFGTEQYPLGRKRCTKLTYLLHRHIEGDADGYLKKAAGPYNPKVKYKGPEAIALKNGYIQKYKSGKFSGYIAGDNIVQAEEYFGKWYDAGVLQWLEQFRYNKNDELELLTTVDMVTQELRKSGAAVDVAAVKAVIAQDPEWKAKLGRSVFSDSKIAEAIETVDTLFG
ncbi:MAG: hypothetical protein CL946_10915 [Ectothiorhodospiraceae bacterium]|nr:hypothetical protein [Ectothiorhodospiraceae bacterium]